MFLEMDTVAVILFFIGIYGLMARRNILKSIIALGIIQSGVILLFLSSGTDQSNPIPQALMITAIVIGISITAVSLTMFITLYHRYGSTNYLKVIKKRRDSSCS